MSSTRLAGSSSPRSATHNLPSQSRSTSSNSSRKREELADVLQLFIDNISSWKSSFEELGTSYDTLKPNVDALEVRFECFLEKAQMTAEAGVTLSDDMADLLETIQSNEYPDPKTEKRVLRRAEKLKRACADMVEKCEKCKENFMQIYILLYKLRDELEEREYQLQEEIKSTKRKASRARAVTRVVTSIGLVASAAAALTTIFFSMGTSAFVVAPIAVSAVAPIVSYVSSNRSTASTKLVEACLQEEDVVQKIIREASKGSDDMVEMTRWWNGVQEEIICLEVCFENLRWGACSRLVYSLEDWKALELRFKDYRDQLRKASRYTSEAQRHTSTSSTGSAASPGSNKSGNHNHSKVDSSPIRVRRVERSIKIASPRRAIALTNSNSHRAL